MRGSPPRQPVEGLRQTLAVVNDLSWEDVLVNFSGTVNENVFYVVAFFIFTIGQRTIRACVRAGHPR